MKIRYCVATLNQLEWVLDNHLPSVNQQAIQGIHIHFSEYTEQRYRNQKVGDVHTVAPFLFFLDSADVPVKVTQSESNLGVAPSWNLFVRSAIEDGYDAVVIANDDIILYTESLERLVKALEESPFVCFSKEDNMFSLFGMHTALWINVGQFDENFWPAYYEDNDYHYRMKLVKITPFELSGPSYYHRGSATINTFNLERIQMHHHNFNKNTKYYVSKWGGLPDAETYTHPFNGAKDYGHDVHRSLNDQLERDFQTFARSGEEV
jgi:GT2 family glycosyltransferase